MRVQNWRGSRQNGRNYAWGQGNFRLAQNLTYTGVSEAKKRRSKGTEGQAVGKDHLADGERRSEILPWETKDEVWVERHSDRGGSGMMNFQWTVNMLLLWISIWSIY